MTLARSDQPNSEPIAMSDTFFDEEKPAVTPVSPLPAPPETPDQAPLEAKRRRSRSISIESLDPSAALSESNEAFQARLKRKRRKRKIILLTLGSVSAFTVFSCMLNERNKENWQGADNGQAAGQPGDIAANQPGASASGSTQGSGYRPSYGFRPWFWLWGSGGNRNSGFRPGGSATTGTSSGFASSGSGTVSRPSSSSSSSSGRSASSGTSRGGFGSIGGALSGSS